jgi:isoleucyl-tRNA synthetase
MTENLYQTLKTFIPEDPNAGDVRSVHFLSFPEVKEEYFDVDIERQVLRMQTVIELTRNIRETNNISLKVCSLLEISIRYIEILFLDSIARIIGLQYEQAIHRGRRAAEKVHRVRTQRAERCVQLR